MEETYYSSMDNYKPPPSSSQTFPNPITFFTNLISLQTEIISTCIISLGSPFFSLLSLFSDSFSRTPKNEQPNSSSSPFLGRVIVGLLAAVYVCIVLTCVMILAAILGVGLVGLWVEEPVYATANLQFDYTAAHPTAVFEFGRYGGVPVGHTLHVSLVVLMPESDYNRDVGIFQLTAEAISGGGELVAKSSRPCMLKFRSWPIRLARTFAMGLPLLLGLTAETQRLSFPILKHKEIAYPRIEAIRVTLIPRAGTAFLPQFYDSEILLKSRPPFLKDLVYRWKWTLYIWSTLYIFLMMVMVMVFFLKPVLFPVLTTTAGRNEDVQQMELPSRENMARVTDEREVSETLRRLQQSRKKRKAVLLRRADPEPVADETATSYTVTRGEEWGSFDEGSGDSESSVCFRGFDM